MKVHVKQNFCCQCSHGVKKLFNSYFKKSSSKDNNNFRKQGNQRWQTSPAPPGGLGHCQTGMCMSNFMMIGWEMAEILHIEISWKHVSVTYDLDLWPKILKIFVSHGVPIRNMYAKFHNDRLRNGWDITLWNFAKTRTNTHTNKQTDMGITIPRPPPMGGEVIIFIAIQSKLLICDSYKPNKVLYYKMLS